MVGREESRLNLRPGLIGRNELRPYKGVVAHGSNHGNEQISHAFVVGAAATFGDDPIYDLVGVSYVAGFAVDAVGGVDF